MTKRHAVPAASMSRLSRSKIQVIRIEFPFSHEMVERVRTIPGRKYHPDLKVWSAPLSVEAVEKLQEWGFWLSVELRQYLERIKIDINDIKPVEIPNLRGTLYHFQERGVAFLEARKGRALIADEMGLGKTIQTLAYLQLHPELRPVLVVCPASIKLNWARETHHWLNPAGRVEILSGTQSERPIGDIVIINYDILSDWKEHLTYYKFQVMITDECHYFKSNKAKRTKAVKALAKHIPHVIALSGTPIVNRPIEIFNAIKVIDPTIMPDYWHYAHRYCGAHHTGFGWDFSGASNTEELHQKLTSTIMLRRLKKDVLDDLPEKIRSFIPIELDNREEYNDAEFDFISFIEERKGKAAAQRVSNAETLTKIETLKQLAVKGKLNMVTRWIEDFLDTDNKLVVFATHRFVIDHLMSVFGGMAVKIDGSVSGGKRDKAVQEFQHNNQVRLFVGNIKAAGIGLTLTAASNVAFIELPWTPGDLVQAEDRCHRIGQKDTVNIHYLLAEDTIEETVAKLLDHKRKVLDSVLDGQVTEEESLLTEIIKQYQE